MRVNNIFEDEWIKEFLEKRNLLKQYKKAKINEKKYTRNNCW